MSLLYVRATPDKGAGVYARSKIYPDTEILDFKGKAIELASIPHPLHPEDDHYLQIGPHVALGPTGDMDNLVNHSCDPNCMVAVGGGKATLIAIKIINADTELTFDYSTTSTCDRNLWTMKCFCGSERCRHLISGFHTVPFKVQQEYIEQHMVPTYVLDHFVPYWLGLI